MNEKFVITVDSLKEAAFAQNVPRRTYRTDRTRRNRKKVRDPRFVEKSDASPQEGGAHAATSVRCTPGS